MQCVFCRIYGNPDVSKGPFRLENVLNNVPLDVVVKVVYGNQLTKNVWRQIVQTEQKIVAFTKCFGHKYPKPSDFVLNIL